MPSEGNCLSVSRSILVRWLQRMPYDTSFTYCAARSAKGSVVLYRQYYPQTWLATRNVNYASLLLLLPILSALLILHCTVVLTIDVT